MNTEAEEIERHQAEVRWCIKAFWPDTEKMKKHFAAVEKSRGKEATDRLRSDVRTAWKAHSIEIAGQA